LIGGAGGVTANADLKRAAPMLTPVCLPVISYVAERLYRRHIAGGGLGRRGPLFAQEGHVQKLWADIAEDFCRAWTARVAKEMRAANDGPPEAA